MLRRFVGYLEKVFDFTSQVGTLRDERIGGRISTASLWLSVFWMFVLRIKSFNALEEQLRLPKRWDEVAGRRRPSADALGYGLCRFAIEPVRALLRHHHQRAWRNKAIHGRLGQKIRVVALDGHELFSSTARCCPGCSIRDVEVKTAKGMKKVRQYYHRVGVAQWVGVTPPGVLDIEPIQPGEGEVVAAGRLWERIIQSYGRLIDVVTLDAIYLEGPFLKKVRHAGKHFVVVMKQERRELYRDADELRRMQAAQVWEDAGKTSRVWDLPELTTFESYGEPVRVVWAEERTRKPRMIGGQREIVEEESTWVWVTNLPPELASARWIQLWGHDRWNLENRGFNELVHLWGMDHCFVHLARAIEVILLTLAVAFLTTYLFFERNLKPEARGGITRQALAQRMRDGLDVDRIAAPDDA